MLIRSQNKMSLVKFENIVININNINGKEIICWSQMNPGEDEYILLGHYSTKTKVMKVLDMIQEAYTNFESAKNHQHRISCCGIHRRYDTPENVADGIKVLEGYAEMIRESAVFQMPADSEVAA